MINYKTKWIQLTKLLILIEYLIINSNYNEKIKFKTLIQNIATCNDYKFENKNQNDRVKILVENIINLINEAEEEELVLKMALLMSAQEYEKSNAQLNNFDSRIIENILKEENINDLNICNEIIKNLMIYKYLLVLNEFNDEIELKRIKLIKEKIEKNENIIRYKIYYKISN